MHSPASLAATRIAAAHGYSTDNPVVVQETNNTVVWLRPHAIIAKVGTWAHSEEALRREHDVATALVSEDAPIAPPLPGVAPERDPETGFVVTLWRRLDHDPKREITATEAADALRHLHERLARYAGELPSFRSGLCLAQGALFDDRRMQSLPPNDRTMLRAAFDRLLADLEAQAFAEQGLHGEPHAGNRLVTASGPRWIDLEAVCVGPLEWDLAFMPEEALGRFPAADSDLLLLLRTLNSARVATWCWLRADIHEMRKHGEHHLERVRSATQR